MRLKNLIDEDFTQYKKPSMFIGTSYCNFKCCLECGKDICQNMPLATAPIVDITDDDLIKRYLDNPITSAIVFGGLDPIDTFDETYDFINKLRSEYKCNDDMVIYTGYNEDEIPDKINKLSKLGNIIVKFGRYIPDQKYHLDEVLGIELASDNQYAKYI